jgi:uncharacterized protein YqgV (UPF0045/DUF77 family)
MLAAPMYRAEFSIYPFRRGDGPPPHVQAAVDAISDEGVTVEVGLLGESITGELPAVLDALRSAASAALAAGATRIVMSLEAVNPEAPPAFIHER